MRVEHAAWPRVNREAGLARAMEQEMLVALSKGDQPAIL